MDEVGLAEGFKPSVKVSCVGGTMKIRVDTKNPFQGIIHGPNRTEPGCYTFGNSGLKTYLNIDLTKVSQLINYYPKLDWVRLFRNALILKLPLSFDIQ